MELMVQVPAPLLLATNLKATAKSVWMVRQVVDPGRRLSQVQLADRCGIARNTLRQGLLRLEAAGWNDPGRGASGPWVHMPTDLLLEKERSDPAKVLYGVLQLTPGLEGKVGQADYSALSARASISANTVKRAMNELARTGWLLAEQAHRHAPVSFTLLHPLADGVRAEVGRAAFRIQRAMYTGEAIMREYLSLLIESDEYEDDAKPSFLVNPSTGERLQFDRYYPPIAAFEFQGRQHTAASKRFSPAEVAKQRTRDLIKRGLCDELGIALVTVEAQDLTLERMRQKIGNLLHLRDLTGLDELVEYLEEVAWEHRIAAEAGRKQDGSV